MANKQGIHQAETSKNLVRFYLYAYYLYPRLEALDWLR